MAISRIEAKTKHYQNDGTGRYQNQKTTFKGFLY